MDSDDEVQAKSSPGAKDGVAEVGAADDPVRRRHDLITLFLLTNDSGLKTRHVRQ